MLGALAPSAAAESLCTPAPNNNATVCAAAAEDCSDWIKRSWAVEEFEDADGQVFIGVCQEGDGSSLTCVSDPANLPDTVDMVCAADDGSSLCVTSMGFAGYNEWGQPQYWENCDVGPLPSPGGTAVGAAFLAVGLALFVAFTALGIALSVANAVVALVLCATSGPVLGCL